jgi:histidinol-phosphatase (PHP family)
VELGNPHEFEKEVELLLGGYQFDVRIASLHWLYGRNIHLDDCFRKADPQEIYAEYFIELGEMASRSNADIIAHFDRIFLRGTELGAQPDLIRLESVIRNALLAIAYSGMALEVNTRYLRSTPGWISALRTVLRWFRAEGGESIVVNSDAHHVDQLGMNEDLALQLIADAGFDEPCHLPERVLAVAG